MRIIRTSIAAAALLVAAAASTYADEVPVLNVEQVCRGIASHAMAPGERGGPDLSVDRCIKSEEDVRVRLTRIWSSFSAAEKSECIGEATSGGESSYTDLLTCLEMAREMRNEKSPSPSNKIER